MWNRSPQLIRIEHLEAFLPLDLDYKNASYSSTVSKVVSGVLSTLYLRASGPASGYDLRIPFFCSEQALFPIFAQETPVFNNLDHFKTYTGVNSNLVASLRHCVKEICSTRNLDPDLGGIGVGQKLHRLWS